MISRATPRRAALPVGRPAASISGPLCLARPSSVFPGEVEAVEAGIAALEAGDDGERLGIVVEPARGAEAGIERALAGMTERRMTEVVGQRAGLGEVLVEAQRTRQRAGDLGHLEGVGEPGAVMIALVVDEHLGLVGEPAERRGMDDPVAVAAEIAAGRARRLGMEAPPARERIGGVGCALGGSAYRHRRGPPSVDLMSPRT